MGSKTVPSKYSDGYSTFTAYATATWDSDANVTISNVYGSNTAFYWRIVLRGDSSKKFIDQQHATTTTGSFKGSFETEYVFQTCGANGLWNNDGANSVFQVTKDSSSGGGDSGGGDSGASYRYLYITQGNGTELTVDAWLSAGYWYKLNSGMELTNAMEYIRISCTALPGYELDKYSNSYEEVIDGYTYTGLIPRTVTINGEDCFCYIDYSDVTITSSASLKQYTLSLSQGVGSLITVTRISSQQSGASIDEELYDGDVIYHFDELQINFKPDAGYELSTHTVNGQSFTSGGTIEVAGDMSIISDAIVKTYTLTLDPGTGSEITVNRIQSPLQNAAAGVINSNETIYYADVLKITISSSLEYEILEQYVNQEKFTSGDIFEVTSDITVKTVTKLHGIAYIYDGASYNKHLIYIYHNGSWGQYIPYVYKDSKWNICS